MTRLILASTSPYRAQLLARLGLEFTTAAPRVEETIAADEPPASAAARLALEKARAVARTAAAPGSAGRSAEPGTAAAEKRAVARTLVIGADQVPARRGEILRKPGSHADTIAQLTRCAGETVVFYTAAAVVDAASGEAWQSVDETEVEFAELTRAQIERYVELERPYDCAGGFRVEGLGIALFRAVRSSDPTGLIGLPLIWLAATLRRAGLDPLAAASSR
ncbi:MAG: septum formation protein Maf [Gammaproteobacteria bacterium]|nr:septum formation protein Maf [Gammaproteobacteria bacterium]